MVLVGGDRALASDGAPGAPAVLLCHGFTGSPDGLASWAAPLAAAGAWVRVPRLPGHGTTWQQMARTTWEDWTGEVTAALLDLRAATTGPLVVGGLSMGGALALRLAADHPGAVDGLVLVNPAVRLSDPRLRLLPLLLRLRGPLASAPGVGGDIAREGAVERAYDRVPLAALASSLRGYRGVVADLPRVVAPLVLLRSAVDRVVPASSSALVLSRVGSGDVREEVLARSRHVVTLDHDADRPPAAVLALLDRLARARAAAGPARRASPAGAA